MVNPDNGRVGMLSRCVSTEMTGRMSGIGSHWANRYLLDDL
jgi:hypothetical protein